MTALIYYIAVVKGPEAWAVRIEKINVAHTRHLIFVHPLDLRFKDPSRAPSHDRQWYICTRASSTGARGQFMQSQPRESIFRLKNGFGPPRCVGAAETGKGGRGTLIISLKNVNRMDEASKPLLLNNENDEVFKLESATTPCYMKSLCTLGSLASLFTCGTFGVILMAYKMKEIDKAALLLGAAQIPERRQQVECSKISGTYCLDILKVMFICKNLETYAKKATGLTRFARWLKKKGKHAVIERKTFGSYVSPEIEKKYLEIQEKVRKEDFSLLCCMLFWPCVTCAVQGEILETISKLPEEVVDLANMERAASGDNNMIITNWGSPMTIQTMR